MNRSGPGFGYGFLVAFCFTLSIFCLLCGLVLQGFQKVVSESLESCECQHGYRPLFCFMVHIYIYAAIYIWPALPKQIYLLGSGWDATPFTACMVCPNWAVDTCQTSCT